MISIPVSILATALAGLGKVSPKRSTLPILNRALVRKTGPLVTLTVTDLDLALTFTHRTTPVPITALARQLEAMHAQRDQEALVIPVEALKTAVRGDNDGFVELTPTALRYPLYNSLISVPFDALPVDEFPPVPVVQTAGQPLPNFARRSILEGMLCASEDQSRFVLQGVYIGRENDPVTGKAYPPCEPHHVIVATDGRHLLHANSLHLPALTVPFILPASPLLKSTVLEPFPWLLAIQPRAGRTIEPTEEEMKQWEADCEDYAIEKDNDPDLEPPVKPEPEVEQLPPIFLLQAGPWSLVGRTLEGNYPNYRAVIPDSHQLTVELPSVAAERIIESLPRLPVLDKDRSVHLLISPETGLTFSVGQNSLPVFAATATGSLRIAFNRDFLIKALRFGLRTIQLTDAMSPAVFIAPGRKMVVMPMRVV